MPNMIKEIKAKVTTLTKCGYVIVAYVELIMLIAYSAVRLINA